MGYGKPCQEFKETSNIKARLKTGEITLIKGPATNHIHFRTSLNFYPNPAADLR